MGQQVLCQSGVIVNDFSQLAGLFTSEKAQGQLHQVGDAGIADVSGGAESRDVGTHQGGKIEGDVAHGE